jgi:lipopolysaccharide biosynthesis protein
MKHCIILHLYYLDLWNEFKEKLQPLLQNPDVHLYVTVTDSSNQILDDIRKIAIELFVIENRGADVAPFIYVYNKIKHLDYATYLKIHGKKSVHTPGVGDWWRQESYFGIVENYNNILEQIVSIDTPWMLGNTIYYHDMFKEPNDHINRLNNIEFINKAAQLLNISNEGAFFAGTMWLVNSIYLTILFKDIDLDLLYNQFELGHIPKSLAHGMERVLGYGVQYYNGQYIKI